MKKQNNYYLWYGPENFPNSLILAFNSEDRKTDSLIFMQGRILPCDMENPHWNETMQDPKEYDLIFHTEGREEKLAQWDCLPNMAASPIVNKRVLDLVKGFCPEDFQAFPIMIQNENPKNPDFENHDYWLLNLTHRIDAVDREKSKITFRENGRVDNVQNIRLKKNLPIEHHLARIDIYKPVVLASLELVALFKKHKIKGVKFLTDEEGYP